MNTELPEFQVGDSVLIVDEDHEGELGTILAIADWSAIPGRIRERNEDGTYRREPDTPLLISVSPKASATTGEGVICAPLRLRTPC
jgi:hypothetical protein